MPPARIDIGVIIGPQYVKGEPIISEWCAIIIRNAIATINK